MGKELKPNVSQRFMGLNQLGSTVHRLRDKTKKRHGFETLKPEDVDRRDICPQALENTGGLQTPGLHSGSILLLLILL